MRITIVTAKPYAARRIAKVANTLFPNDTLNYLVCWPVGVYVPAMPRGLRWHDYPHIAPYEISLFHERTDHVQSPMRGPMVGGKSAEDLVFDYSWDAFNSSLAQADQIISMMDPSSSLYHFEVARTRALGSGAAPGEVRIFSSFDDKAVAQALLNGTPEQDRWGQELIAYGRVRHYFDYQFALNSLAILSKTLDRPGAWISKYQLQLLYALGSMEPATEGEWIGRMRHWAGTGRYPLDEKGWNRGLGSSMSRVSIFEQVSNHGWVREINPVKGTSKLLTLSAEGRKMIDNLHPKCEDADLPFRLDAWAHQGLDEAKPSIDRYVLTFFGRQKRFM